MDTCRICFEEVPQGTLASPCACDGTSKFVHQECLLQWIHHSNRTVCEICKTPFPLQLEPEEHACPPSHWAHRLLINPFFHIFVQYLIAVALRPVNTYSAAVHLFLGQHLLTIGFYLLYLVARLRKLRRYMLKSLTLCYSPLPFLHGTLFTVLVMSRTLPVAQPPPLLLIFMCGCHMMLCVYPLHHAQVITLLNRNRQVVLA